MSHATSFEGLRCAGFTYDDDDFTNLWGSITENTNPLDSDKDWDTGAERCKVLSAGLR